MTRKNAGKSPTARRRPTHNRDPDGSPRRLPGRFAFMFVALAIVLALFFTFGGLTRLSHHFSSRAIDGRELAAARWWLDLSERLSPRDAHFAYLRGRLARHEGDLPAMRKHFERAATRGFDAEPIRRQRVLAKAQSGRLDEVEREINRWLASGEGNIAEISDAYANGLAKQSRVPAALTVLEAWHADFPDDPRPRFRIGRIKEYAQLDEEAKQNYRAAVDVDPDCYRAWYALGRILLDQKQIREARACYERCLEMPEPAAAKVGVARCLAEAGESERAADMLREVLALPDQRRRASYRALGESPERFIAAAELGKLAANAGRFEEAKRWLEKALESNPRDIIARYSYAVALRGLGLRERAEEEFQRVRTVKEKLEAAKDLQNQIRREPQNIQPRLALGELLLNYESEQTGLFWLRSVLTIDPDNPDAHRALADYYQARQLQSPHFARLARQHREQVVADNGN